MDYTPPSFRNWLISENQDVVLFSLRLIRIFKQTEAQQALLMFLHHKSEKIQIAALECIREFRYVKARPALITIFDQSSAEIKIHILNTLEAIGSSKDIPWVQDQSRTDESFLVRSKAGMVANALDSTYEKHDAAVQHEFEFEMDNGEDEVFEKPVQQHQ